MSCSVDIQWFVQHNANVLEVLHSPGMRSIQQHYGPYQILAARMERRKEKAIIRLEMEKDLKCALIPDEVLGIDERSREMALATQSIANDFDHWIRKAQPGQLMTISIDVQQRMCSELSNNENGDWFSP
jgi:hypothetical protein